MKEEEKRKRRSREFIDFKELVFPVLLRLNYIRHSIYYLGLLIMFYTYLPTPKKTFSSSNSSQQPATNPPPICTPFFFLRLDDEGGAKRQLKNRRSAYVPGTLEKHRFPPLLLF
jgi:hypothetical protein